MSDYKLEKELVNSAPYLIANYKDAQEFIEEARANGELVGSEWRGKLSNENERKKLFEKFVWGDSINENGEYCELGLTII